MNDLYLHNIHHQVAVLIDTWWNVNIVSLKPEAKWIGFNRYMVECESGIDGITAKAVSGFNRYMVECEFLY